MARPTWTVHSGREKAVYAYPAEHYAYWRTELPGVALAPALSGRTSPPTACSRTTSRSATASGSARPN
ncbi:MAG TPA: MOSC domain-containing protein [Verrucomicrobiae bacterium]|nr:MOSC domain-containing protein [Verrucomicrobiae bacterium]